MRIGVDATCWANIRGYGRFTREICAAMIDAAPHHEFVFFADDAAARVFELRAKNVRLVTVAQSVAPTQAASADSARSPLDMLRLTAAVRREPLDVFFSPSVYTYFPLPPGLRAVVCIHDCIAERFPELTLPSRRARLFWSAKVKLALWQARRVLTVSEYSARDLERVLKVKRERIDVAVEAPAAAYAPVESRAQIESAARKFGLDPHAPWFTYVGGFNPHKHVDTIVRALGVVSTGRTPRPQLALVGSIDRDVFHGDQARIRRTISELGLESQVVWTGFVADDELRALHSGATALLLPSECEGFGLPAVEAAACGAPVIATIESPLPELLAGAGVFVKPGERAQLESAMRSLLDDAALRARCSAAALEQVKLLSWPRAARAALDSLERAAR